MAKNIVLSRFKTSALVATFLLCYVVNAGVPYESCNVYYGNTVNGPDGECGSVGAPCNGPTECANYANCGTDGFCGGLGGRCLAPDDYHSFGDDPFPCLSQFWCGGEAYGLGVDYRTCSECPSFTTTLPSGTKPYCACKDTTKYFDFVSKTCNCAEGFVVQDDGSCLPCPSTAVDQAQCKCGTNAFLTNHNGVLSCDCYDRYYRNDDGKTWESSTFSLDQRERGSSCGYPGTVNPDTTGDRCLCPPGVGLIFNKAVSNCVCAEQDHTYDFSSGACVACPAGQVTLPRDSTELFIDQCRCPSDTQYVPNYQTQTCVECPTGAKPAYPGASYCVCASGQRFQEATGTCEVCPPGTTGTGSSCFCTDGTLQFDEATNSCFPCPSDTTNPFPGYCRCTDPQKYIRSGSRECTCDDGTTTSCNCAPDQYRNVVSNDCKTCPSGTSRAADGLSCTGCGSSAIFDPTSEKCVTCPSNSVVGTAGDQDFLCTCNIRSQFYHPNTNTCECAYGMTLKTVGDLTACMFDCPSGTKVSADGSSCSCLNPSFTFSSSTMSCSISDATGSNLPRSKAKRRALDMQRLLNSYAGVPWKDTPDSVLCPQSQQACGIAPSMEHYECLDTMSEVESCGGCTSSGEGVNCLEGIPGVVAATCDQGICVALSCKKNFTLMRLDDGNTFCEEDA